MKVLCEKEKEGRKEEMDDAVKKGKKEAHEHYLCKITLRLTKRNYK